VAPNRPVDKHSVDTLSVEDLRRLLVERRRAVRQDRLEHYRRTGRVVVLAPDGSPPTLDDLRTESEPDNLPETEVEAGTRRSRRTSRRNFFDRLLIAIEIAAVAGLVFVILSGLNLLRDLNREVATALIQPTLTPTPLIGAVILPSGHTPPDSPGGAQPNEDEIPDHLRPLVQSLALLPVPTPGPEQANRIQIPAIKVDAPVVQGDGWEQLKKGVGQAVGTINPGQDGNLILSAHNDVFGEIFRDLDQLEPGDAITLLTQQHQYTYEVVETRIVLPSQVEVMAPATEPVVTLISCYPYRVDKKRIVVIGRLVDGS
jgi:sortase A